MPKRKGREATEREHKGREATMRLSTYDDEDAKKTLRQNATQAKTPENKSVATEMLKLCIYANIHHQRKTQRYYYSPLNARLHAYVCVRMCVYVFVCVLVFAQVRLSIDMTVEAMPYLSMKLDWKKEK